MRFRLLLIPVLVLAMGVTAPSGYVYSHDGQSVIYGQPHQISAIRSRLTAICTDGKHLAGLGPAQAIELIQVGNFAIVEGSCGNPELHAILRNLAGTWNLAAGPACRIAGGVTPNYGRYGLYDTLLNKCAFPLAVVKQIIAIRSQQK